MKDIFINNEWLFNMINSILGITLTVIGFRIEKRNRERDKWEEQEAEKARAERDRLEMERRNHEDEERRIQWTLDAYNDLYRTVIQKIEVYDTPAKIKERFSEKITTEEGRKEHNEKYKEFRQFIDQLELFGKGLYDCNLYHMDTFLKLSNPSFPFFVNKRVENFFEARKYGANTYIYTRRLIKDTQEYYDAHGGVSGDGSHFDTFQVPCTVTYRYKTITHVINS